MAHFLRPPGAANSCGQDRKALWPCCLLQITLNSKLTKCIWLMWSSGQKHNKILAIIFHNGVAVFRMHRGCALAHSKTAVPQSNSSPVCTPDSLKHLNLSDYLNLNVLSYQEQHAVILFWMYHSLADSRTFNTSYQGIGWLKHYPP